MGWTVFACFGYTNKRKRPKTCSKFGFSSRRRRITGYKTLQSDVPKELDVAETLCSPRRNPKDEKKMRIRKKVRFNLDVVTYEPLSSQDDEDDINWDGRGGEETEQPAAAETEACLLYVPCSKTNSTESSYRYNNYYDGEDEYDDDDDDSECQISDDDDHDSDSGCTVDLQNIHHEEILEEIRGTLIHSAGNTRLRSHYIAPVLNPVENLSQWKAVKMRKC